MENDDMAKNLYRDAAQAIYKEHHYILTKDCITEVVQWLLDARGTDIFRHILAYLVRQDMMSWQQGTRNDIRDDKVDKDFYQHLPEHIKSKFDMRAQREKGKQSVPSDETKERLKIESGRRDKLDAKWMAYPILNKHLIQCDGHDWWQMARMSLGTLQGQVSEVDFKMRLYSLLVSKGVKIGENEHERIDYQKLLTNEDFEKASQAARKEAWRYVKKVQRGLNLDKGGDQGDVA